MILAPKEHDEQVALFDWADRSTGRHPELSLMFAVPNGGARNIIVAKKLKDEGVKRGVPDLMLAAPRRGYHGLFIEMKKVKGGRVSPEQTEWKTKLQAQGYRVEVCAGFEAAKETILEYLK
jgi:hypothetical protein